MSLVLPPKFSRILLCTSCGTLATIYKAATAGRKGCTILTTLLLLTSVNYWRNPRYGFRRNLDIFVVVLNVLWYSYVAFHFGVYIWYIYFIFGIMCYNRARKQISPGRSVGWHALIHILVNIGNIHMLSNTVKS